MRVILAPNERKARNFASVLKGEYLPDFDGSPFSENSPFVRQRRIKVLYGLLKGEVNLLVCTLAALSRFTMSPRTLETASFEIVKGKEFTVDPKRLVEIGYIRVDTVREFGEVAIRGDIIDIYSPTYELPIRIELLYDAVDDIRFFNPATQRAVRSVDSALILPAREYLSFEHEYDTVPRKAGSASTIFEYFRDVEYLSPDFETALREYEKKLRELKELASEIWNEYKENSLLPLEELLTEIGEVKRIEIAEEKIEIVPEEEKIKGAPIVEIEDITVGDIVVHKDYGIGKFEGLERIKSPLGEKDYLKIRYADSVLYVPVHRMNRLHKYLGSETVKLDSLKGSRWRRRVRSVKRDLERRIRELVKLYARRSMVAGLSLVGDSEAEEEFAKSFPYIETADQLRAIEDVLTDLASEKPMDRLVCGDSGYGKTEVALRATFRTVISGKQVAVLAPTVVLANQHYRTFKERLEPFGVKVELLDSTKTGKERVRIKDGLRKGEIDVVIGTHSLLADDIRFSDLGLVVIDEEQKFGVEQKEKLKKMRLSVNVLSMSATPIPRTLHMALSGMKDISVINTPPIGRKPVTVYVAPLSDSIIKSAVLRELARGGQVIYVHNRVEEIPAVYKKLSSLLPDVSIAIAHGRMNKRKLEKAVEAFVRGDVDLLLCTTVIESGMDIASANTIIVDDAHRYGLAQLYQLRGRVGRREERGYAYFLYPPGISDEAMRRLKVIETLTGPGSGIEIALRDLEIRGYGDVLGIDQSGHIESIGYRYYVEILKETIGKMKGEEREEVDVEIVGFPGSLMLPEEYIPDPMERLRIYRRLSSFMDFSEVDEMEEELKDRFGKLPPSAKNLLKLARLKIALHRIGVKKMEIGKGSCALIFRKKIEIMPFEGFKHLVNEKAKALLIFRPFEDIYERLVDYFLENAR